MCRGEGPDVSIEQAVSAFTHALCVVCVAVLTAAVNNHTLLVQLFSLVWYECLCTSETSKVSFQH